MTKLAMLRTALAGSTALAALFATPAMAQNLPDTGNVTVTTAGLSGGAPGSTNPTFSTTPTPTGSNLQVDLRDNRTILNWGGTGFNIASGYSVDFKDARATSGVTGRTDNIAVLNRAVPGYYSHSNIQGLIHSDPNVAVYLINTGGIVFGSGATVDVGSLLVSTLNVTSDNDFLTGSSSLRFSDSAQDGAIDFTGNVQIRTASTASTNGGRMGDVVVLGQGAVFDSGVTISAPGDFAVIAARDVTVQNSPASPLSFTINAGADTTRLSFGGAASARNILFALGHNATSSGSSGFGVPGTLTATGASATDRGVILTGGVSAPGVIMSAAGLSESAPSSTGGTITSAKDIYFRGSGTGRAGKLTAAGLIELPGGSGAIAFYGDDTITADHIILKGAATFSKLVRTTGGGIAFDHNGTLNFQGGMDIAGDVSGRAGQLLISGSDVKIGGSVDVSTSGHQFWDANIQIGGSVTLSSDGTYPDYADLGDIIIGHTFIGSTPSVTFTAGGNVKITTPSQAVLRDNVTIGGDLEVDAGTSIYVGDPFATVMIKAAGAVSLKAGSGGFVGSGNVPTATVQSNSDGVGSEELVIETTGRFNQPRVIYMGGPANQSDARIRWGGNQAITLGGLSGRTLYSAIGNASYGSDLNNTSGIDVGNIDFMTSLSVTGLDVAGANWRVRNGNLTVSATQGDVTVTNIQTSGAVKLSAIADPADHFHNTGGVKIEQLTTGGDVLVHSPDILITNSLISGSMTLESTGISSLGVTIVTGGGSNSIDGTLTIASGTDIFVTGDLAVGGDATLTAGENIFLGNQLGAAALQGIAGSARFVAQTGNIVLQPGVRVSGANVVLSTSAAFENMSGPDAVTATDHWVVYSADPAGDTFGNLDSHNTAYWNATLATLDPSTLSGNRYVFAYQPTATISVTDFSKVYGTDLTSAGAAIPFAATGLQPGISGAYLGDTIASAFAGSPAITSAGFAARASVAGGPYSQTLTGVGTLTSPAGYAIVLGTGTGFVTVTAKALTATVTADNKTYDGTTAATGSASIDGVVTGDTVGLTTGTYAFADKNAGTGKTVNVSGITLTGTDAGNYTLTVPATVLADIFKKALTINFTADSKTYDGTTATTGTATFAGGGVVGSDDVHVSGASFAFADKNAGTGKTVHVTGVSLSGADAGNYTFEVPASLVADILKKAITGSVTANNKTYDGTTTGSGTVTLNGAISGDDVAGTASFTFADKNAGTGKAVTVSGGALIGTDAGNYTLTLPASAIADILRKALTVTVTADDKTYDGTTAASGSVSIDGVISGDTVGTTTASFAFADKNAGTGKTVNVSGVTLTGTDAGNYSISVPATVLADILKKAITGTATVNGKTYDGTTAGSGSVSLSGVVSGDTVGTSGTVFAFADKNAGTGKTVNVSGTTLTGSDAGNYTLTVPATALGDILKKALTLDVTANSKTYDGTAAATGSVSLGDGVVSGDSVGLSGGSFAFADKNAGSAKSVTLTGVSLTGADAGNYSITIPAGLVADIFRKSISATATANNKTYDGSTAGTGTVSLDGVVSGDSVGTAGSTFTFADKNAGTGKAVAVNVVLSGADAGNYSVTVSGSVLADILKKALTGTYNVSAKTYDGTTAATGSVMLDGVVSGDSVGTSGTIFAFADKNAGTGKTVNASGTTLTGADAGNYTLSLPASAIGDILRKALSITFTANSKTYDGTAAATGSATLDGGVVSGDDVSLTGAHFAFADKNAGTGKAVTVTGIALTGEDAGNYTFTMPGSLVADIFRKAITGSVTVNSKTYDGTAAATGTVALDGVLAGDVVDTSASTFLFANKNAGAGKAVTVNAVLGGADGGNYSLTLPTNLVADIFKKAITATVSADTKTYDGTTAGSGTVTLNGIVNGDVVGTSGTAFTFSDKNAGTGKTVTITGTMLSGADAGNYTLTVPQSVLGTIAKRALTIQPDAGQSKNQGDADPVLTFSIVGGSLVSGDQLGGSLGREAGELPGNYAILIGTLSAGANYDLHLNGESFAIFARVGDSVGELQALKVVPLPQQLQVPGNAGDGGVTVDDSGVCGDDPSCTVSN